MAKLPTLKDPNFKEAARFCNFCKDYCENGNHYSNNGYNTQALIYLGCIKNSATARKAEETCKQCDYKSARIASLLEPYGINI